MSVTRAVEQQQNRPSLVHIVQQMRPEIERALPRHMDADRMARLALTVIRQTPKLAECNVESFCGALLTASALGLEPGINGEAYLVPYKGEATLIIGYQGMVKLFWQHPLAAHIDAQAVYEHDEFDYAYGLDPHLTHKPARGERGKITDYYAVAALTTGARVFEVLTAAEVKKLRGGKTGSSGQIPDPQHWMERKTVLRQLIKRLPRSTQLVNAAAVDERTGTDLAAHKVPESISENRAPEIAPAEHIDQETGEVVNAEIVPEEEPEGWA